MNRRKFFGMTAAALVGAGLPLSLLPKRSIFLPPRFGWKPSQLGDGYLREVCYTDSNTFQTIHRFDAMARDIWGKGHQFHVEVPARMSEYAHGWARKLIEVRFKQNGLIALPARDYLTLPYGAVHLARYI